MYACIVIYVYMYFSVRIYVSYGPPACRPAGLSVWPETARPPSTLSLSNTSFTQFGSTPVFLSLLTHLAPPLPPLPQLPLQPEPAPRRADDLVLSDTAPSPSPAGGGGGGGGGEAGGPRWMEHVCL